MPFCSQCGTKHDPGANFCGKCGARISVVPAPQNAPHVNNSSPAQQYQPAAPAPQPVPPAPQYQPAAPASQPVQPESQYQAAPVFSLPGFDFSRIPIRRCCRNGHVTDGNESLTACPKCGDVYTPGGIIHIYRMGNMAGMAVGMGIYINDVPYGHLGNKKSIRISLPYGQYKIHMTHTATRSCSDPVVSLSPQTPYICFKAHYAAMVYRIALDFASPADMPKA